MGGFDPRTVLESPRIFFLANNSLAHLCKTRIDAAVDGTTSDLDTRGRHTAYALGVLGNLVSYCRESGITQLRFSRAEGMTERRDDLMDIAARDHLLSRVLSQYKALLSQHIKVCSEFANGQRTEPEDWWTNDTLTGLSEMFREDEFCRLHIETPENVDPALTHLSSRVQSILPTRLQNLRAICQMHPQDTSQQREMSLDDISKTIMGLEAEVRALRDHFPVVRWEDIWKLDERCNNVETQIMDVGTSLIAKQLLDSSAANWQGSNLV